MSYCQDVPSSHPRIAAETCGAPLASANGCSTSTDPGRSPAEGAMASRPPTLPDADLLFSPLGRRVRWFSSDPHYYGDPSKFDGHFIAYHYWNVPGQVPSTAASAALNTPWSVSRPEWLTPPTCLKQAPPSSCSTASSTTSPTRRTRAAFCPTRPAYAGIACVFLRASACHPLIFSRRAARVVRRTLRGASLQGRAAPVGVLRRRTERALRGRRVRGTWGRGGRRRVCGLSIERLSHRVLPPTHSRRLVRQAPRRLVP